MHQSQHRIRGGLLAGTIVMAVGLLGGTAAAQAAPDDCVVGPGVTQTATTVTGSPDDDTIDCGSTVNRKTINGIAGNDTITGNDQPATINGDAGNDIITSGAGNDIITGGDGNDTITSGVGNDTIDGGLGIDNITGSAGDDNLVGPSNDGSQDTVDGGDGNDTCQGPAPDPDIHMSCENTSTLPATGPGSGTANATDLCRAVGGTFVSANPVGYSCLLIPGDHRLTEARKVCQGSGLVFVDFANVLLVPGSYTCLLPRA
jgi:hypothetical protein